MSPFSQESLSYLRCPACRSKIKESQAALRCVGCDRAFSVQHGIPALLESLPGDFAMQEKIAASAREMIAYPLLLGALSLICMTWIPSERKRLISRLGLQPGQKVLDHCSGPGGNLPAIAEHVGDEGKVVGMDLVGAVLVKAQRMARRKKIIAELHQADALSLPYADGYFDAVIHYGAINQFGDDKQKAIDEMMRVTRDGGTIAICDEGIEESVRKSLRGRLLIARNELFACRPPMDLLPAGSNPQLEWIMGGIFYEIRLKKPSSH